MIRGGRTALLIGGLTLAGCAAPKEVSITPIADPAARLAAGDLSAARGQLLLGNAGLALEAFRNIHRDRPGDPRALAGIADCYAAMGRFDLAQSNYEAALALAPHDPTLLTGLAAIYQGQGDLIRAIALRHEAAAAVAPVAPPQRAVARAPAAAPAIAPRPQTVASMPKPAIGSVTVQLPKATPARAPAIAGPVEAQALTVPPAPKPAMASATVELPKAAIAQAPAASAPVAPRPLTVASVAAPAGSATVKLPKPVAQAPLLSVPAAPRPLAVASLANAPIGSTSVELPKPAVVQAPAVSVPIAPKPVTVASVAKPAIGSITVELPPARPIERPARDSQIEAQPQVAEATQPKPSSTVTVALPPARPAPAAPPRQDSVPQAVMATSTEPRLVRLSRGEVALVTRGRPLWREAAAASTLASTEVRWIPLRDSGAKPNVRILNAARHQGLAGSARTVLLDRGWRKIAVGDAPATQATSVVYYPRNRAALGHSLAAQFGVSARQIDGDVLFLVLGRDGVGLVGSQQKS